MDLKYTLFRLKAYLSTVLGPSQKTTEGALWVGQPALCCVAGPLLAGRQAALCGIVSCKTSPLYACTRSTKYYGTHNDNDDDVMIVMNSDDVMIVIIMIIHNDNDHDAGVVVMIVMMLMKNV